jgi:hypothetical protein
MNEFEYNFDQDQDKFDSISRLSNNLNIYPIQKVKKKIEIKNYL